MEQIYSIFKAKKLFLEEKIDTPKIIKNNYKFIERFENGNILLVYYKTASLFDKTFNFIYKYIFKGEIIAFTYINNKQFIILDKEGIHLFSEYYLEENIPEENNENINIPLIRKKDFIHDFLYKISDCLDKIIYNKSKIFLAKKNKIYIFNFSSKNKKIELRATIKNKAAITSFILFRNIDLMITYKNNHNKFLSYEIIKGKPIFIYNILEPQQNSTEILYNYNNRYFLLKTDFKCYIYDYEKNNILLFKIPFQPDYQLKITKNYLIIIPNDSLFIIYDKEKDFTNFHVKRLLINSLKHIEEFENNKIGIFLPNQVALYSKNNKIKICGFALLRIILIFVLLFILYESLNLDLLGLILKKSGLFQYFYKIIGILILRLMIYIMVNYFILYFLVLFLFLYNSYIFSLISDYC